MPKPARNEGPKMNFDPMTDTITNVAAAMIRLVILVLLITHAKTPEILLPPGPPTEAGHAGRPVRPLLADIELLKAAIRDVDNKTAALEKELPALRDRVGKLRQAARAKSAAAQTGAEPFRRKAAAPDGDRRVALAPPTHRGERP